MSSMGTVGAIDPRKDDASSRRLHAARPSRRQPAAVQPPKRLFKSGAES